MFCITYKSQGRKLFYASNLVTNGSVEPRLELKSLLSTKSQNSDVETRFESFFANDSRHVELSHPVTIYVCHHRLTHRRWGWSSAPNWSGMVLTFLNYLLFNVAKQP